MQFMNGRNPPPKENDIMFANIAVVSAVCILFAFDFILLVVGVGVIFVVPCVVCLRVHMLVCALVPGCHVAVVILFVVLPQLMTQHTTQAGTFAGIVSCAVAGPVELVKTRLQLQFDSGGSSHKGSFSYALHLAKVCVCMCLRMCVCRCV